MQSVEDNLSGRQPQWKTTSVEDDHIRLEWKTTVAKPQQASQHEPELGTAQPQLVLYYYHYYLYSSGLGLEHSIFC